jgi:hypothetical protein
MLTNIGNITRLSERRGILAATTVTVLIFSVIAGTGGITYFYEMGKAPQVTIINLANDDVLPAGPIKVKGTAASGNGDIKAISIRVDNGAFTSVIPNSVNDFSEWSVELPISTLGSHTIVVEAVDRFSKIGSTKISVVVKDAASLITMPQHQIIEATEPSGAFVHYPMPTLQENERNMEAPECFPASGTKFPIGTTKVTCTATLTGDNLVSADFTVSVRDNAPPAIIAPPDVIAMTSGAASIQISLGTPVVKDAADPDPIVSNNAPANGFELGTTIVVWTALDDYGNKAMATQKVTVTASETGSRSYSGGGGGGGGSSSNSNNNDINEPSSPEYDMTINSVDLSGKTISGISATVNSNDGTTLKTGNTPLKFTGNSRYTVTLSDTDNMTFDHWENGDRTETRSITLDRSMTITAYYTLVAEDPTELSVEITKPAADSTVTAVNNRITVEGRATEEASEIHVVEVRVDDGDYVAAIPRAEGDWSSWKITLQATAGQHRLVPRVTDNAGNQVWNSIYVTIASSPSGGGGGSNTLDKFGIEKMYPTASGGNEWYVNMNDPTSDSLFRNLPSMTKQSDGSWQVSGGDRGQVRMEAWSPTNEKWLNVEITMYAKMVSGSNELLQLYSRGGHHTSSNECLGSAYKGRLYGDGDAAWVKEVTHPAYAGNRGNVQATSSPLDDRWIGFKAVIYNFVENGKTYVRLESYIDDDVTDSSGNLVIGNNWQLASVYEDKGGWATTNSDFNGTCFPMNKDSTQQYRQRDEILNLPGGTSTQNIAAFRSDDLTWNWKYLSVREIVLPS